MSALDGRAAARRYTALDAAAKRVKLDARLS